MEQALSNVSILAWPPGMGREAAAAVLVEAMGMDPFMAGQRAAKVPPFVVTRVADAVAGSVKQVFKKHGVGVFILSDAELARVPGPVLARRLEAAIGAPEPMYMVEAWRGKDGDVVGMCMSDVYCIVRARVPVPRVAQREEIEPGVPLTRDTRGFWEKTNTPTPPQNLRFCDVIDLWLIDRDVSTKAADGRTVHGVRRVRINGDKFNWDVLGKAKGLSDNENADRLGARLVEEARGAAVELGFTQFCDSSEAALGRGRNISPMAGGGGRISHNSPFEFYSAWCGLLNWKRREAASRPVRRADQPPPLP